MEDKTVEHYAKENKITPGEIRASKDLSDFIQNGLRFSVAKEEFYITTLSKMFDSSDDRNMFISEVAKEIKRLAPSEEIPPEVLAEAYRIAASDLCFLQCPAYDRVARSRLFRDLVRAELP